MNLPAIIYTSRWLIRDTFRQSRASGIFWFMLAVSGLCILVCMSVGTTDNQSVRQASEPPEFLPRSTSEADKAKAGGIPVVKGQLTVAFGAFRIPLGRDAADAIHFVQLLLAGAVADAAGILLALIWTAGFLPAFLDPDAAIVLLAKPIPRWGLLFGKFLGVVAFVAFQAVVFILGTYVALGVVTGYWDAGYLLCFPVLLLHFGVFFSFTTLLAVWMRSTALCVVGSILFWLLCWGMNFGHHVLVALPHLDPNVPALPAWLQGLTEAGYWFLPKPADLGILLSDLLKAGTHFGGVQAFAEVQKMGAFFPELSVLSDVIFGAVLLAASAWQLASTDY